MYQLVKEVKRYINYGVISSPHTIYKDLYKVEPGQILEFNFLNTNIELKRVNTGRLEIINPMKNLFTMSLLAFLRIQLV